MTITPPYLGSFPLTVTVTTMGYRSYKNPLYEAPSRTVTRRGNDPIHTHVTHLALKGVMQAYKRIDKQMKATILLRVVEVYIQHPPTLKIKYLSHYINSLMINFQC